MALAAVVARPTDQDTDDLDLVAGVRGGDDRAFELLYLRYQGRIAAYVRSMVHDHGRAEDITQEVFISAFRRMRETGREIAFKPWLYEIAKNACIDAFRRSRHCNEVSFDAHDALGAGDHDRLAGMGATPDTAVDTKVALDNLRGAFGGLSETHHQILVMRELEGLSYRDIGERLGMSRPAVESTLFRARRRLGEEYDELVSGKRCLRVRAIVDAGGRSAGVRDRRRMNRHISHCQPCRRYALAIGVDLESRPSLRPAAAKIAALVPLPAIVRHRVDEDAARQLLCSRGQATVAQWSASVAGGVDPGALAGWSKAAVAAATVAVAGVGAGAAITERETLRGFASRAPAIAGFDDATAPARRGWGVQPGFGDATAPAPGGPGVQPHEREDATRRTDAGGGVSGGRRPGLGGSGGPGKPTDAGKPPGGAPQGGSAAGPTGLGPIDDVLQGAVKVRPRPAGGGEPSARDGSGPAAGIGDAVGDISGATGSTLSDVKGTTAAAARPSSQPVANVAKRLASNLTTTVDTALPGT